ncbi:MAG: 50S ribosomal protein L10 [Nitrospira sp.]|nr:50S ribosomal protein L10 [Candidatus Manganitrophaceae bacterium]HIL35139.1 50S ribosomal protein L10 [Candidatus Manganitrophaceae bacterium]
MKGLKEKKEIVTDLQVKFSKAKVAILAEFSGMGVEELREVRGHLRSAKGEFHVVKNTLAILAAAQTSLEGVTTYFKGQTAVALGYDDPIAPAKAMKEIADKQKKLKIKVGVVEGQVIDLGRFKQIAQLPPKPVLITALIGRLQSPIYGFAGSLNGVLSKFVLTLQAVKEKRESSGS